MHTLAYQWLATHHVAASTAARPTSRRRTRSRRSTDSNGVRDVHGTFQVPLFLADTTRALGHGHRRARQPEDQRHARRGPPTSSACCRRRCRPAGRRRRRVYGHGLLGDASEVEGGSFSAGVARRPHGLRDRLGRHVGAATSPNVGAQPAGHVDVRHPGRPHAPGLRELPVPRPPDQLDVGLRHRTPRSSRAGKPLFKTHDCHFMGYSQGGIMGGAVSALSTEWSRVDPRRARHGLRRAAAQPLGRLERVLRDLRRVVHRPRRPAGRAAARAAALGPRRERGLRRAPHRRTRTRASPAKQIFIIENYGDHQVSNVVGRDAGAHDRRAEPPARVQRVVLRRGAARATSR